MTAKKWIIIVILIVFLLITWMSVIVPYIGGDKSTNMQTWDVVDSGAVAIVTGIVDTWSNTVPLVSKEESAKQLQQMLSGLSASGVNK